MTSSTRPSRAARGFTLLELMIAVAIVALLASIAVPAFHGLTLRARAAERRPIMVAIVRAIESTTLATQALPGCTAGQDCVFWAAPNPPAAPATSRLPMDWTLAGWGHIAIIVEGGSFYQYWVLGNDLPAVHATSLVVTAVGDLDGDGLQTTKVLTYQGIAHALVLAGELPVPGTPEDEF